MMKRSVRIHDATNRRNDFLIFSMKLVGTYTHCVKNDTFELVSLSNY